MSKCGKYWDKVHTLDGEIVAFKQQLADLDRHLKSPTPNPALQEHRQVLLSKITSLGSKRSAAELAASDCEAREHQKKHPMG
ncbi:hypothetical protein K8B33_08020 [Alcanivorax sp. JB21]|uniref:hypothetical protein n=1 Tax=Alcanivorax limicola TaxID=2874102 RepID=UPI001CC0C06F|nr:hypothetical protein [Alcanivorax limicola]MBZ2189039.1 hypothetical protein [Alcanivorax limicola]